MKINHVNQAGMVNPYRNQAASQAGQVNKKDKARDGVEFSYEARKMLEEAADPSRAEKIAELKQSVTAGTYHIEAEKLAAKLLPFIVRSK